ncbi:MAG TPA: hypothetical protein V6C97_20475 [Oculatellaceae cyanobacterium]
MSRKKMQKIVNNRVSIAENVSKAATLKFSFEYDDDAMLNPRALPSFRPRRVQLVVAQMRQT